MSVLHELPGLPKTRIAGTAPDIVAQAEAARNFPVMARIRLATSLIGQSRAFWRGTDEEIFAALGFRDAVEYWQGAISEVMKEESFAHLLAVHLLNPSEHCAEFKPVARLLVDRALSSARREGQTWFINDRHGLMLRPRDAVLWLLSKPQCRELVSEGLRAFVEGFQTKQPAEPLEAIAAADVLGAPGRPSCMHLIEAEYRRRHAAGELPESVHDIAVQLFDWFGKEHPTKQSPGLKTISNRLYKLRQKMPDA